MNRLFGKINMTWPKVILFAVLAGVYTGFVMLIPALSGTSFQDIGIHYEWWVIFAVIIVVNCKKSTDAMLKCFVFFLISQPLVYLVEILFGDLTFDMAWMYYSGNWMFMTFLTLPGGFIAYYCKKQNLLGSIIMAIGNAIEIFMGVYYVRTTMDNFPYHLLSAVVSFGAVIVMSWAIQKDRKYCAIAIGLGAALTAVGTIYLQSLGRL